MDKAISCNIPGCKATFRDALQMQLHTANTYHCPMCGFSDGKELTAENQNKICPFCVTLTAKLSYYKVDFKRKCYLKFKEGKLERFVAQEKGKWVSYG